MRVTMATDQQTTVLFSFVFALMMAALSDGCTCQAPKHPQEHFCHSQYVILGRVLSRTEDEATYTATYRVQLKEVFKEPKESFFTNLTSRSASPDDDVTATTPYNVTTSTAPPVSTEMNQSEDNVTVVELRTALHDSLCGVHLQEDRTYVMGGRVGSDGRLYIGLCDLHMLDDGKEALNKRQKAGFYRKYGASCDCKIVYCTGMRCPVPSDDQCSVEPNIPFADFMICANRYSMCKRRDGKCFWAKNSYHTNCQNQARYRRMH